MSDRASRLVVLVSGRGSNFQAILDAIDTGRLHADVTTVISNKADCLALERAQRHGIPTRILSPRDFGSREDFDAQLAVLIKQEQPDLVVLAGYMRLLSPAFVEHFMGRLVNIHPSLLPSFPGLHTHERAIECGVKIHGATVHFVTRDMDAGPIIIQAAVPVLASDTPAQLAARVLTQEHLIYPQALEWLRRGWARLEKGKVRYALPESGQDAFVAPHWPPPQ